MKNEDYENDYMQNLVDRMNAELNDSGVTVRFEPYNDNYGCDDSFNQEEYDKEDDEVNNFMDYLNDNYESGSKEAEKEYEDFFVNMIKNAMMGTSIDEHSYNSFDCEEDSNYNSFLDDLPMTFSIEGTGYEGRAARIEYVSVGDILEIEGLTDCPYFADGLAIEVFNDDHESLGYLSISGSFIIRSVIDNIGEIQAKVVSVTPLSKRRANAKYALMDIELSYIDVNKCLEDIQNSFAKISNSLDDMQEQLKEKLEITEAEEKQEAKNLSNTQSTSNTDSNSGGCYIATCVYGSYDCPEVWTLRRFRDYTLAKTWHGRAFIHTYYALAPTLVKLFGNTKWFKSVWQSWLDRKIQKLNDDGVENTPYQDREW